MAVAGRRAKKALLIVACLLAAWSLAVASSFSIPGDASASLLTPALARGEVAKISEAVGTQGKEIKELNSQVEDLKERTTWVLYPIGVLLAVLTLGGGFSIVFSIREQRRASQLHELNVVGEVSSQRRAEQSYGSFLDQSQTTIALVNDTLRLAREASDREARSGQNKAEERVGTIEELSEALMLQMFREEDFELLIDNGDHRRELNRIGGQLRELEASLTLQDIKIPPYTAFVKAMAQFLRDDTESAIHALRRASQSSQINDLHRFTLYWLGYMLTTVSEYTEAIARFRDDEIGLPKDDAERLQLERMIVETEFFRRAKPPEDQQPGKTPVDARSPRERFAAIADLLDHLSALAADVDTVKHSPSKVHTSQEIAQTRADLYAWIAYDPERLDLPIDDDNAYRIARLGPILATLDESYAAEVEEKKTTGPAVRFAGSKSFEKIRDGDPFRVWALIQARAICEKEQEKADLNFYVTFALAECYFKLKDDERAKEAFSDAERRLDQEFGEFQEKRRIATLKQSLLLCHSRDLALKYEDSEERSKESKIVLQASRDAQIAVQDMAQPNVTVFSQIQRRNISQEHFKKELEAIVEQEKENIDEGTSSATTVKSSTAITAGKTSGRIWKRLSSRRRKDR
jgi:tetratricopeptide (TPR) repeat protein